MAKRISPKRLKETLPFKDPFLFIDEVISYDPQKKIIAAKKITGREWFFKGHFPKNPIMPGHIIAEAMVQACSLLFGTFSAQHLKDRTFYLAQSKARFFYPVKPRDKLVIEAFPVKIFSSIAMVRAEAHVKKRLVACGEFTISIKRKKTQEDGR